MNYINVKEPRWHDKTALVASWKVGDVNQITIDHHEFPTPYYMTGQQIRQYPTTEVVMQKHDGNAMMYVIPLKDLSTDLVLDTL